MSVLLSILSDIGTPEVIFGAILTIAGTIIGIFVGRIIRQGEITLIPEKIVFLVDEFLTKNKDFEFTYQGKETPKNLALLRLSFLNTGPTDISIENVDKKLELNFPDTSTLISSEVIKSSNGVTVNTKRIDNLIKIDTKLIRKNEYFTIEAIVDYNDDLIFDEFKPETAEGLFEVDHRIKDVKTIKKMPYESKLNAKTKSNKTQLFSIGAVLILVVGQIFTSINGMPPTMRSKDVAFEVVSENNDTVRCVVFPINGDSIVFSSMNTGHKFKMHINEFYMSKKIIPVISKHTFNKETRHYIQVMIFFSILFLAILIRYLFSDFQKAKLKSKVNAMYDN